jgi:hypothetical protein
MRADAARGSSDPRSLAECVEACFPHVGEVVGSDGSHVKRRVIVVAACDSAVTEHRRDGLAETLQVGVDQWLAACDHKCGRRAKAFVHRLDEGDPLVDGQLGIPGSSGTIGPAVKATEIAAPSHFQEDVEKFVIALFEALVEPVEPVTRNRRRRLRMVES